MEAGRRETQRPSPRIRGVQAACSTGAEVRVAQGRWAACRRPEEPRRAELRRWAGGGPPHPAGARPPLALIALTCRCPRSSPGRSTCVPAPGAAAADPGSGPAAPGPLLPGSEEVAAPSGKLRASSPRRSSLPARRSGSSVAAAFLLPGRGRQRAGAFAPPVQSAGSVGGYRAGGVRLGVPVLSADSAGRAFICRREDPRARAAS